MKRRAALLGIGAIAVAAFAGRAARAHRGRERHGVPASASDGRPAGPAETGPVSARGTVEGKAVDSHPGRN